MLPQQKPYLKWGIHEDTDWVKQPLKTDFFFLRNFDIKWFIDLLLNSFFQRCILQFPQFFPFFLCIKKGAIIFGHGMIVFHWNCLIFVYIVPFWICFYSAIKIEQILLIKNFLIFVVYSNVYWILTFPFKVLDHYFDAQCSEDYATWWILVSKETSFNSESDVILQVGISSNDRQQAWKVNVSKVAIFRFANKNPWPSES